MRTAEAEEMLSLTTVQARGEVQDNSRADGGSGEKSAAVMLVFTLRLISFRNVSEFHLIPSCGESFHRPCPYVLRWCRDVFTHASLTPSWQVVSQLFKAYRFVIIILLAII